MPIIKSAIKRMRQTAKRRTRNVATKRDMKNAVKAFLTKPTAKGLSAAQAEIDTAVKKNVLQAGTAARRKASLSKIAKDAGVKLETTVSKAPVKKAATKPAAKAATKKPAAKKAAAVTKTTKAPAKVSTKPAAKKAAAKSK